MCWMPAKCGDDARMLSNRWVGFGGYGCVRTMWDITGWSPVTVGKTRFLQLTKLCSWGCYLCFFADMWLWSKSTVKPCISTLWSRQQYRLPLIRSALVRGWYNTKTVCCNHSLCLCCVLLFRINSGTVCMASFATPANVPMFRVYQHCEVDNNAVCR